MEAKNPDQHISKRKMNSSSTESKIVNDSSMSISSTSTTSASAVKDEQKNKLTVQNDKIMTAGGNANVNANTVDISQPESKNEISILSANEIKQKKTTPNNSSEKALLKEQDSKTTDIKKKSPINLIGAHVSKTSEEEKNKRDILKPPPSSGKRDRDSAFHSNSVLEILAQNGTNSGSNTLRSSPLEIERLPKIARVDSADSSQDPQKDGNSSDDSSNDGNLGETTRLSDSDSLASCTILGPTNGSTNGTIQNLDSHKITNPAGTDDEFEMPECDAYFLSLVKLDPVPSAEALPRLLPREVAQLEHSLQIGPKFKDHSDDYNWRDDWNGNLQLLDKDLVMNREALVKNPMAKQITIPFYQWVAKFARHAEDFTLVRLLFSYVSNMDGAPPMAKRILAHYIQRPASSIAERLKFIEEASDRISYDPIVLKQDGWTTAKSDAPDGATGGAYMIGRKILWQRSDAIVIAFVRDDGLGDLWKCMWVGDFDTFDLEADELQEGIKRWERKVAREKSSSKPSKMQKTSSSSARFEQSRAFTVNGVEDGIILATSYKAKGGRPWPARIMHVAEVKAMGQLTSRRSSSKNEVHVVFLAPYWNGQSVRNTNAKSAYSTGPLFELETIDVSAETIQEYPHDIKSGILSIEKLRSAFTFLGLPQSAFARYLDSHRIALSLKAYASERNREGVSSLDTQSIHLDAYASLTDTHPLSVRTFSFPDALLNLPFEYTLEKYPPHTEKAMQGAFEEDESTEPIMNLSQMLDALCPPRCWGQGSNDGETNGITGHSPAKHLKMISPTKTLIKTTDSIKKELFSLQHFCSEYLIDYMNNVNGKAGLKNIRIKLQDLVLSLNECIAEVESVSTPEDRREVLRSFLLNCMLIKGQGEDIFFGANSTKELNHRNWVLEWRKACERIFKRALVRMGHINTGNGVTAVLTDSRCNQHITAKGSFERAVRLPAAIRGAKNAGAGAKQSMPLVTKIEESYMELAEEKIIPMAHKASYLRRLKTKIAALPQDVKGAPLTDDSDGEGGEDTMGSRGSYTAAVVGIAAALKAADMVVGGKCVNSFCAIRPPGHHAGRELRPMNAISNGFCLLNAAACAALYATSPLSEGGLGLKRVCVVDIDVHHGNGTQDILASTYDPRFLYISTHAGGPHINGYSDDKLDDGVRRSLNNKDGIFPGRCGDTSPHKGVLNLPLGQKITPSALGTALVCQVTPAIEKFSPELIIISAGFDAHKNDPLGLGGLSAEDFGTVTKVLCQVALKICSGRVISILEGGYGVPCCRPLPDLFLPPNSNSNDNGRKPMKMKLLKLGNDLPDNMEDPIDIPFAQKLDRCHQEGFMDCVKEHVLNLSTSSDIEPRST